MPKIVLINPEIPPNTGNIARSCAATNTPLHLVRPLGFELSDKYLKRAGLDYWPHVDLHLHESAEEFWRHAQSEPGQLIGFSARSNRYSTQCYTDIAYSPDDWLIFGKESQGLSADALEQCDLIATIPMPGQHVRSLNLSVSAAVGLFEAIRQTVRGKALQTTTSDVT